MERGFEQLILFAFILLAGVFDLLVRWLKSRRQKDGRVDASRYDENPVLVEEEADFELSDDVELFDRELSGEELIERGLADEEVAERRVPPPVPPLPVPVPVVTRRPAPPEPSRPRRVSRRLLTGPLDARRGIVLMTILGPCRGLERADSDADTALRSR